MAEIKLPSVEDVESALSLSSNKTTDYADGKKDIEPLNLSGVKTKNKTLGERFRETFLADDIGDVKEYIFRDVLIPGIKSAIGDVVIGSIEMILWGSTSGRRHRRGRGNPDYIDYVDYASYSRNDAAKKKKQIERKNAFDYENLVFASRTDAVDVLDAMCGIIDKYDSASIADLYELVGRVGSFTQTRYGWTSLDNVKVKADSDGYFIDFPRPYPLD